MNPMKTTRTLAIVATVLLQGCAAIVASNEPHRTNLIPKIQQGMTRDQVQALMGPPDETMAFNRSQTVSWDYRYRDTWGYLSMYSVTFNAQGVVASTFSRRLGDGGEGKGR